MRACTCDDIKLGDMVALCTRCNGAKRGNGSREAYKLGAKDERERIIKGLEVVSESIKRIDGVYSNELLDFIESLRNEGKSECWQCGVFDGFHTCPKCGCRRRHRGRKDRYPCGAIAA